MLITAAAKHIELQKAAATTTVQMQLQLQLLANRSQFTLHEMNDNKIALPSSPLRLFHTFSKESKLKVS
mgnify:CR=1 FL=1